MFSLNRRKFLQGTAGLVFIPLLSACEKKDPLGPQEIHWDRDQCDRCKMVISERNFVAQVINKQTQKAYKFDDIGCVPLWFKEENISWKENAIIYVADMHTKAWLDARTAQYTTENITPMAYGFGAHSPKEKIEDGKEVVNFEELTRRVLKKGR